HVTFRIFLFTSIGFHCLDMSPNSSLSPQRKYHPERRKSEETGGQQEKGKGDVSVLFVSYHQIKSNHHIFIMHLSTYPPRHLSTFLYGKYLLTPFSIQNVSSYTFLHGKYIFLNLFALRVSSYTFWHGKYLLTTFFMESASFHTKTNLLVHVFRFMFFSFFLF